MCGGISARVGRPAPSVAASPQRPEPSATTPASTAAPTAGFAVGVGCCMAWQMVLPCKRRNQQQQELQTAVARAVTTYPTPPRATIRRLTTNEGSLWASLGK